MRPSILLVTASRGEEEVRSLLSGFLEDQGLGVTLSHFLWSPSMRDRVDRPAHSPRNAGSHERTGIMAEAFPLSRFQVEERLVQLLAHLGLDQAHFAARLDN